MKLRRFFLTLLILLFLFGMNYWDRGQEFQSHGFDSQEFDIQLFTQQPSRTKVTKINAPINVACVFAIGGLGDLGFNDMVYRGLQKAETDGLCTFTYSEPSNLGQIQGFLEGYASSGSYDLIVAVGFAQKTAVNETAKVYPTQAIVLIDDIVEQGNVRSVLFKENEGSFLVGALAGLMTNTGRIGFLGGMDIELIRRFWAGYTAGAMFVNNNSCIEVIENFVGSFNDPTTGKSMAEAMWNESADIVFAAAGESGTGALESVSEQGEGYYGIGIDVDQDFLFPGDILCSMMKRMDIAVYKSIRDVFEGRWSSDPQLLGLADDGVGISPLVYTKEKIGSDFIQEVNVTLRNKIISGEIVVPINHSTLSQWIMDMGIKNKTYSPHGPIWISSSDQFGTMGFNGSGSISDPYVIEGLYINDSSGPLIGIDGITDHFLITNNLLNGLDTTGQGISLTYCQNGLITDNTIIRTNDGIRLDYSDFNTVTDNVVFNNSYGIMIDSSSDSNTISYNTLFHNRHDGIAVGGAGGSHMNTISHNTLYNNVDTGMWLSDSTDNLVLANEIFDNGNGIILGASNLNVIVANNISKSTWSGILIGDSSNSSLILENRIFRNGYNGIQVVGSSFNTEIALNTIYDNLGWAGIELGSSIGGIVDGNIIYNHPNGNGVTLGYWDMVLDWSDYQVINNVIFNSRYRGIRIEFSNGNLIEGNTALNNQEEGIWAAMSTDLIIISNIVENNLWNGIGLESSANCLIENNNISNNIQYAVILSQCGSIEIYRNNFIGNGAGNIPAGSPQVLNDEGSNNAFMFNYWDDWTSPDSDFDGYVDNPYFVDGSGRDSYPLATWNPPLSHLISNPTVLHPSGGETIRGIVTIRWAASVDYFTDDITYSVFYSDDGGTGWSMIASGLETTSYLWDTNDVLDSAFYKIKVLATCSLEYSNENIGDLFSIQNDVPITTIPSSTTTIAVPLTTTTGVLEPTTSAEVPTVPTSGMTGIIAFLGIFSVLLWKKKKPKL
ncbi:MAG: BMP family ABC transporter substrate-binding protein [Candidatus Hermodarchaeota archaeon]